MNLLLRTAFACLVVGMSSRLATATIIVNTDQSASGALGTVNLPGGVTGMLIQGTANSGALLNFMGTETLTSPSSGQARVEGLDGSFQALDLRFSLGQLFDRIVFNLDASADGSVTVQAFNQANTLAVTQVLSLSGNGQNFINVAASGADHIHSVSFTTNVALDSIAQVRVDAINSTTGVPEPSTWAMIGFGLLGLGMLSRRKPR